MVGQLEDLAGKVLDHLDPVQHGGLHERGVTGVVEVVQTATLLLGPRLKHQSAGGGGQL